MSEIKPIRIQRKRVRGFNMQAESIARNALPCVYVGRPTKYGNPFKVGDYVSLSIITMQLDTPDKCLAAYNLWLLEQIEESPNFLDTLCGKNLACFCDENAKCHADILLELANQ